MATLGNGTQVSTPGYKSGSSATSYNTVTISNVQTDVANNKTTFNWKLNVYYNANEGNVRYAYKALGLWINGTSKFFSSSSSGYGSNIWGNGEERGSGSAEVYHNDAGEASVTFEIRDMFNGSYSSARWADYDTSKSSKYTHQGAATFNCPTIARKSSASFATNFNIGSNIKISIARKSSSFTHKIELHYGSSATEIASGVGTEWTWKTGDYPQLYSQIPGSNRGSGNIVVKTYNGSTYVGENVYGFTANVVNSNPTFDSNSLSYEDTNAAITAITGSNQKLFKGYSHLKVNMSSGGTAYNYATLGTNAYTFSYSGNSNQYANGNSSFPLSRTFNTVSGNAFTVGLTDSRGNSVSHTKNIAEVYQYTAPHFTKAYVQRINPDFTGDNITVSVEGTYDNWGYSNKNACKDFCYRYKETDGSWTDWFYPTGMTHSNGKFIFNENIPGTFGIQNAYEFQFYIADKLSNDYSSYVKVDPAKASFYIDVDKNIIGLCGIPENPSDNCAYYKGKELGGISALDVYPVGSIYLAANTTNPGTLFGGTWTRLSGAYLFAMESGTPTAKGGSTNTGSTAITTAQMPAHNHGANANQVGGHTHTVSVWENWAGGHTHNLKGYGAVLGGGSIGWRFGSGGSKTATGIIIDAGSHHHYPGASTGEAGSHNHNISTTNTGSGYGHTHTISPPWLNVVVWQRTA